MQRDTSFIFFPCQARHNSNRSGASICGSPSPFSEVPESAGLVVVVSSSINQKFSPGVGAQIAFQQANLPKRWFERPRISSLSSRLKVIKATTTLNR